MGQFYALKYFADDLRREIRYPISEVQEATMETQSHTEAGTFPRKKRMISTYDAVRRTAPQHLPLLLDGKPEGLPAGRLRFQQEDDLDSER